MFKNPLYLNPSMSGFFDGQYRINAQHRSQWSSVSIPFKSTSFSVDRQFNKIGIGVQLLLDESGTSILRNNQLNLLFSNKIQKWRLGVQLGVVQRSINYSNLNFSDTESFVGDEKIYFDFGFGVYRKILINKKNIEIGFSSFHLNKPDQSFSENKDQLNIRSNLHSKVEFNLSEYWDITPTIVLQKQNAYQQILFGSFAEFDISSFYSKNIELELGLFHRWRDAISILMGAKFENTSVTLSYDWNISDLVPASNGIGAWEISFIHIINNIISRPNSYKVCPIYL